MILFADKGGQPVMKKTSEYRKVLLLKVPHHIHPDGVPENENFRLKSTFQPILNTNDYRGERRI
jgi:hypothetical protein